MGDAVPAGLYYTKEHEWLNVKGDIATVGITDHAQGALGDLVYVELPEVGAKLTKDGAFAVVESVKAASEVYAPVSGEVLEINEALSDAPETINDSPYEKGWIAKIKLTNTSELEALMDQGGYKALLKEAA